MGDALMGDALHRKYARLLRWYPPGWRAEHGRLMLDTLEQQAVDQGRSRTGFAEAWSLRAHGLAERATPRWAVSAAALSLAFFALSSVLLFSGALAVPGWWAAWLVSGIALGPLALMLSALIVLHRMGRLSADAAAFAAGTVVFACGFTALTAASWSVGMDEADAGRGLGWFGSATPVFFMIAWLACTAAFAPLVAAVVPRRLPAAARLIVSICGAAVLALASGVVDVTGQVGGGLVAAVMFVLALVFEGRSRSVAHGGAGLQRTAAPAAGPRRPLNLATGALLGVGTAAAFSLVFGLACAAFALVGSNWSGAVRDSTHAMNLGLAMGALVAVPLVLAAGWLLSRRFGVIVFWSTGLMTAGLVAQSLAQFAGVDHALQTPLMFACAVIVGMALALPVAARIAGTAGLRAVVTAVLGLAATPVGFFFIMAGFVAPVAAAILLVWVLRQAGKLKAGPAVVQLTKGDPT